MHTDTHTLERGVVGCEVSDEGTGPDHSPSFQSTDLESVQPTLFCLYLLELVFRFTFAAFASVTVCH